MRNLFVFFSLTVLFASCSSNVDLAIDNPTSNSIIIKVDSLTVEIPANEVVWVEMGKGEHTITLENDSVIKFNFQEKRYFINPTLSEYLMMEEVYGSESLAMLHNYRLPNKAITYLGIEIDGHYDVIRDVINPISWEYGPREALPGMIEIESGSSTSSLIKLYDIGEVIELLYSVDDTEYQSDSSEQTEQPVEEVEETATY